jgi:hypothetical protein
MQATLATPALEAAVGSQSCGIYAPPKCLQCKTSILALKRCIQEFIASTAFHEAFPRTTGNPVDTQIVKAGV